MDNNQITPKKPRTIEIASVQDRIKELEIKTATPSDVLSDSDSSSGGERKKNGKGDKKSTKEKKEMRGKKEKKEKKDKNEKKEKKNKKSKKGEEDKGKDDVPRDPVTGRALQICGVSCLRCIEKGLRCTLRFVDPDQVPQCAGCSRAKAQYCVRMRSFADGQSIPYLGPPWKDPNFVAGIAEGGMSIYTSAGTGAGTRSSAPSSSTEGKIIKLDDEEMMEILREHFEGRRDYVLGDYLNAGDVAFMALPPFNGSDIKDLEQRPDRYKSMDWRAVLPTWKNRALNPVQDDIALKVEMKKKALEMARLQLSRPAMRADEIEDRERIAQIAGDEEAEFVDYLRTIRRYPPRERNLVDINDRLGETH